MHDCQAQIQQDNMNMNINTQEQDNSNNSSSNSNSNSNNPTTSFTNGDRKHCRHKPKGRLSTQTQTETHALTQGNQHPPLHTDSRSPSLPSSLPLSQSVSLPMPLSVPTSVSLLSPSSADTDECVAVLSAEDDTGSIEYKWKLMNKSSERLDHLTTQMKYRLREGGGQCRYELGILDNGYPEGLTQEEMNATISTLTRMANTLSADVRLLRSAVGRHGVVAEVLVSQRSSLSHSFVDIRLAVIGHVHSGKSTIVGVLCSGEKDNGQGSARMNVFKHRHEIESGHTADRATQLLGFDQTGNITNRTSRISPSSFATHSWSSITEGAQRIISFFDLVGVESGQKVTIAGILSESIDYALLCISAEVGVTESDTEHIQTCLALELPIIILITKIDLVHKQQYTDIIANIQQLVSTATSMQNRLVHIHDTDTLTQTIPTLSTTIPVFTLSSVTCEHVDLFSSFLSVLPAYKDWTALQQQPAEFVVDSVFRIDGLSVIGGILLAGQLNVHESLLIGPIGKHADFLPITVHSIQVKRTQVSTVHAGQLASLAVTLPPSIIHAQLRRGLAVCALSLHNVYIASLTFDCELSLISPPDPLTCYYEPIIYMPNIRQSATLLSFAPLSTKPLQQGQCSPTTSLAIDYCMTFRFVHSAEMIKPGMKILIREGKTKGIGHVTKVYQDAQQQQSDNELPTTATVHHSLSTPLFLRVGGLHGTGPSSAHSSDSPSSPALPASASSATQHRKGSRRKRSEPRTHHAPLQPNPQEPSGDAKERHEPRQSMIVCITPDVPVDVSSAAAQPVVNQGDG